MMTERELLLECCADGLLLVCRDKTCLRNGLEKGVRLEYAPKVCNSTDIF